MVNLVNVLRSDYLDTTISTSAEHNTRIVERPGRWMDQTALDALANDLRTIALKTMPAGSLTYGVFAADRQRLKDSIITLVSRRDNGQPIAFNALAIMEMDLNGEPVEVLHLGLVMIDPNERSKGFSWVLYGLTCFLLFLRNGFRPLAVSSVTQVPAVVGMVAESFSDVYPLPGDGSPRQFTQILMARQIMAHHRHVFGVGPDAIFDETRFVIQNAYTGGSDDLKKSFIEAPKHRDETFNDFCAAQLDYERGDDFLQLGVIDMNTARHFVTRSVPRGSVASVAAFTGLVLVRRLILPILHWLNDTQTFGSLRPWKS